MSSKTAFATKCALMPAVLVAGLSFSKPAAAEVTLLKSDTWELFTSGRVDAFFSYGWGDALPLDNAPNHIPPGGGLDPGPDGTPAFGPDGTTPAQGTFRSMRVRSGFVPNVLGIGLKRKLNEETTLKVYLSIWGTLESESLRKAKAVNADFREGYLQIHGPWGTVTAGRALDLFSRGATENDFLYGHGYGLGFPGNIDTLGPTNGMIGFGVLAAFFSPGIMYATPSLGGLQLSVGIYDPSTMAGTFESTRYARPESELTYDLDAGLVKAHIFANGAWQRLYLQSSAEDGKSAYGAGYGGRIEVGPVHLGVAGHYGKGLGLDYALQPGSIVVSPAGELRTFDGYSALGQYAAGPVDLNVGWGMSRTFQLDSDKAAGNISLLKNQQAISAGIVYHATENLHLDIDYLHGTATWFLGEHQKFDFINTGVTATW